MENVLTAERGLTAWGPREPDWPAELAFGHIVAMPKMTLST